MPCSGPQKVPKRAPRVPRPGSRTTPKGPCNCPNWALARPRIALQVPRAGARSGLLTTWDRLPTDPASAAGRARRSSIPGRTSWRATGRASLAPNPRPPVRPKEKPWARPCRAGLDSALPSRHGRGSVTPPSLRSSGPETSGSNRCQPGNCRAFPVCSAVGFSQSKMRQAGSPRQRQDAASGQPAARQIYCPPIANTVPPPLPTITVPSAATATGEYSGDPEFTSHEQLVPARR